MPQRPVAEVIAEGLSDSLMLLTTAWVVSGLFGGALGVITGKNRDRWPDRLISAVCYVFAALPTFWFGLLMLLLFAVRLGWFPIGLSTGAGVTMADSGLGERIHHMILPALTLSTWPTGPPRPPARSAPTGWAATCSCARSRACRSRSASAVRLAGLHSHRPAAGGGAAVCGGWADRIVLWLIDLMQGMPHLVLMIFLSILVGRGIPGVMIGVAATHRVSLARIVRAETIHLRASPYVIASRQMGRGRWFIARAHFPPHIVPQVLVSTVLMFPHAILHESGLTFLGFGIPGQLPAVGVILSESVRYLSTGAWWLGVLPGLALLAIVLVIDRCGDSLQALVSPASAQNQELVMPLLEIDGLRVGFMMYRSLLRRAVGWAVDGLDCAPEEGRVLGIVGASGSGKSLLIVGLLPCNARTVGTMTYDGRPLTPERTRTLRGTGFALIPQSIGHLDPLMRVRRQLFTGARPDPDELAGTAERFGMRAGDLDKFPFQLSGGMARRVLLATAMLSPARLIHRRRAHARTVRGPRRADARRLPRDGRRGALPPHHQPRRRPHQRRGRPGAHPQRRAGDRRDAGRRVHGPRPPRPRPVRRRAVAGPAAERLRRRRPVTGRRGPPDRGRGGRSC